MFYYTSQNPTAPQISNRWGDLNAVINYVIDGGSSHSIDRIEWYKHEYVKVYYTGDSPVYNYETVTFNGSVDYDGKKFIVMSLNVAEKYFIARNTSVPSVAFGDINNSGMTCKIVPCGAKRKHGGVADKRTVIRFGDKFDIRIDDRNIGDLFIPKINWDNNAYKFIRICGTSNFETLDFTTERQIPFNSERPNLNFVPTNDGFVSENIFAYNIENLVGNLARNTYTQRNVTWRIWADENVIYIHLQGNRSSFVCGFGLYDCYNKDILNGFIYSQKTNYKYNNDNFEGAYVNTRGCFGADYSNHHSDSSNNHTNHALIYDDSSGNSSFYRQCGEFGLYQSLSGNGGITVNNMSNNTIFHSDIVLSNPNRTQYYGKYYGLRWVVSNIILPHDYVYIDNDDNKMYMSMKTYFGNNTRDDSIVFVGLTYD